VPLLRPSLFSFFVHFPSMFLKRAVLYDVFLRLITHKVYAGGFVWYLKLILYPSSKTSQRWIPQVTMISAMSDDGTNKKRPPLVLRRLANLTRREVHRIVNTPTKLLTQQEAQVQDLLERYVF